MRVTATPTAGRGKLRPAVAAWCGAIALLAGIVAAIGVFARGDGAFETVTSVRGETYQMALDGVYRYNAQQIVAEGVGWDVFTLVVAVPAMMVAAAFVARGSFRGSLVAGGLLGYFLYMYLEYAVTWAFGPLFVPFVAIYAASLVGLVGIAVLVAGDGLEDRFTGQFPRRAWAALSIGMSGLLTIMWAGRIAQASSGAIAGMLHGETTMTVQALDLGLVVPISLLIAAGALRRHPVGLAAAAAYSVTFVAMSAAIVAMMLSASIVNGELQLPPIVMFGAACLAGAVVALRMHASIRPSAARPEVAPRPPAPAIPADVPAG
jgi:hypothetical protein